MLFIVIPVFAIYASLVSCRGGFKAGGRGFGRSRGKRYWSGVYVGTPQESTSYYRKNQSNFILFMNADITQY